MPDAVDQPRPVRVNGGKMGESLGFVERERRWRHPVASFLFCFR
ncbi:hypothetical protein DDI_0656 [Dickeya dianthicola RNS04.9]|nr:hypothetical protein DDI_0656 [Dickeya dianthicola RNS04.9]